MILRGRLGPPAKQCLDAGSVLAAIFRPYQPQDHTASSLSARWTTVARILIQRARSFLLFDGLGKLYLKIGLFQTLKLETCLKSNNFAENKH